MRIPAKHANFLVESSASEQHLIKTDSSVRSVGSLNISSRLEGFPFACAGDTRSTGCSRTEYQELECLHRLPIRLQVFARIELFSCNNKLPSRSGEKTVRRGSKYTSELRARCEHICKEYITPEIYAKFP